MNNLFTTRKQRVAEQIGARIVAVGSSSEPMIQTQLSTYEETHLLNLAEERTTGYEGRDSLQSELGHLATLRLLRELPRRHISEMQSGKVFDLAEYVELTETGSILAQRIKDLRKRRKK
jgi:hypothetical protein